MQTYPLIFVNLARNILLPQYLPANVVTIRGLFNEKSPKTGQVQYMSKHKAEKALIVVSLTFSSSSDLTRNVWVVYSEHHRYT